MPCSGIGSRMTYGGGGSESSPAACLSRLPGKRARPVLRGPRRGDAPGLPDYWAVDTLRAAGARVRLAHPLGVKGFRYRRVKNDVRDAADLADLLRMGRLPEAWIAPPATRELREVGALSGQNCGLAFRAEGPGARGARQGGGVDHGVGPVRCRWPATAGQGATGRRLRLAGPLVVGADRYPRWPRGAVRCVDRRPA